MIREILVLTGITFGLFLYARSMEKRIQRQECEATQLGFEASLRMIDTDLAKMNHELADLL